MASGPGTASEAFRAARDFLLAHREDYDTAYREFRWPELDEFNWALDWFDAVAADPERGSACTVDRRAGRLGGALDLRRAVGAVQPGGQLAARRRACAAATG